MLENSDTAVLWLYKITTYSPRSASSVEVKEFQTYITWPLRIRFSLTSEVGFRREFSLMNGVLLSLSQDSQSFISAVTETDTLVACGAVDVHEARPG
jgi:hypothetical protein